MPNFMFTQNLQIVTARAEATGEEVWSITCS